MNFRVSSNPPRYRYYSALLVLTALGLLAIREGNSPLNSGPADHGTPGRPLRVVNPYGKLPLSFEVNQGQADSRVKFLSRGRGYSLFLTGDSAVFALRAENQRAKGKGQKGKVGRTVRGGLQLPVAVFGDTTHKWRPATNPFPIDNLPSAINKSRVPNPESRVPPTLRMKLVGSNPQAKVVGLEELPGKSNYLIGNDPKKWRTNIANYAKVKYKDVYPGIDLVYYGNQGQLEYDWVVAPGADPGAIRFAVESGGPENGNRNTQIVANGDLIIATDGGEVRFHKPLVYQEQSTVDSRRSTTKNSGPANRQSSIINRQSVQGHFVMLTDNRIGFAVAAYDKSRPLIIDPVLSYSTYLSGADSMVESAGTQITSMAVDVAGSVYVTGSVTSSDFATSPGAYDPGCGSDGACGGQALPDDLITLVPPSDIFVAKFNPEGSALLYSTYLGGGLWDSANAIAVDGAGNAYVAGVSNSPDYPTSPGAPQPACGSDGTCNRDEGGNTSNDAVLAKLSSDGSALIFSTFLGGSGYDQASGLGLDASGNAYVGGMTTSIDFPTTTGAFRTEPLLPDCGTAIGAPSCSLGFVAKVDPTGASVLYSTLLGGGSDWVVAVAADAAGHAYVTGETQSSNFPTTAGAFRPSFSGGECSIEVVVFPCPDVFVTELDLTGSSLVYSTYLGGVEADRAGGIAVDAAGGLYVSGTTQSSEFPTTPGALQTSLKGGECFAPLGASTQCPDAFVAKFDPAGSGAGSLVYSTFLGGQGGDYGSAIKVDAAGNAYITGTTSSLDFPTKNPIQAASAGEPDVFVSEIDPAGSALVFSTYLGGGSFDWGTSLAIDTSAAVYVAGSTYGGWPPGIGFPTTAGSFENGPHSGSLGFVSKIAPDDLPAVILDPSVLSFADQVVSTTSSDQIVTLRNMGSAPVTIGEISTTAGFSQANDCGTGIGGGQTCSIHVTFAPSTTELQTGELRVTDNASGSPHIVALQGNNGVTSIDITPIDVEIGPVEVGETSTVETITVTNTGTEPMDITNIAITGAGATGFQESSNCASTLAPGESCTISVTYTAETAGNSTAQLAIYDSSSTLPRTVNLSATTADFALAVATSSISVAAGQSAQYNLNLTPSGGFNQSAALTCTGAPQGAVCTVSPNPVDLSGSSEVTATVTVTTTARAVAATGRHVHSPPLSPWARPEVASLALLALCCAAALTARRRDRLPMPGSAVLGAAVMLVLLLWTACGGSAPVPRQTGTPAGTYTLTVTATSGSLVRSTTLTLTVR